MRKSRYTDSQILVILKQNENGVSVPDLCRENGMSSTQFYKWRSKFGGMDAFVDEHYCTLLQNWSTLLHKFQEVQTQTRNRPRGTSLTPGAPTKTRRTKAPRPSPSEGQSVLPQLPAWQPSPVR